MPQSDVAPLVPIRPTPAPIRLAPYRPIVDSQVVPVSATAQAEFDIDADIDTNVEADADAAGIISNGEIIPLIPPAPDFAPLDGQHQIPLAGPGWNGEIGIQSLSGKISLNARAAPVGAILEALARQQGLNIVTGDDLSTRISVSVTNVPLDEALNAILTVGGYTWVQHGSIILVTPVYGSTNVLPDAQDRQLRVFPLNFASAKDVEAVVTGLLSPYGKVFTNLVGLENDVRRTQEQVVVEDLPMYIARIAAYVAQIDCPPRQVMLEARVLEVTLKDDLRHGVNWDYMARIAGANVNIKTQGFANPLAAPAFLIDVKSTDLDALLEALRTTTDVKTLAAPKVLVLNGQEARIQIGEQLGYFVTSTTETSTLQNVNFLDVGVVLRVKPSISDDNQILLTVKPEVSTGVVNETTGLPSENTSEVETTVLLGDGNGMIIGGLIKETDSDTQSKVPILGDLRIVGRLFQRRTVNRERREVIFAIIPRIVPYTPAYQAQESLELTRVDTPLLYGPLKEVPRPFEPQLPDAIKEPRRLRFKLIPDTLRSLKSAYPTPLPDLFPTNAEIRNRRFGRAFGAPVCEPIAPGTVSLSSPDFTESEMYVDEFDGMPVPLVDPVPESFDNSIPTPGLP